MEASCAEVCRQTH